SAEINVWLTSSQGLRVIEPSVCTITLHRNIGATTSAVFEVAWTEEGEALSEQVMAVFSQGSRHLGWVSRGVSGAARPAENGWSFVGGRQASDLTLWVVNPALDGQSFEIGVECPALPEYTKKRTASWRLPMPTGDLVNFYFTQFGEGNEAEVRLLRLNSLGDKLNKVCPPLFTDALEKLEKALGRALKILIVSEEPHFPWELIIPKGESRPIGARHLFGRVTDPRGKPPPQSLRMGQAWVMAPNYLGQANDLPRQKDEANYVCKLTNSPAFTPVTVKALLEKAPELKSLLHFIGHGAVTTDELSQKLLLDRAVPILQIDLEGMRPLAQAFGKQRSLVFLNACHAGSPVRSL